jgi:hypothetical protein
MAHRRTEFTESQKSTIYARDRATCALSGISLWLLDYGIRPNWDMDWVDHIRPSASGGKADIENGVCASSAFNFKKRSNAADNVLFFHRGSITKQFILVYGSPSSEVIERLQRLERLKPIDWFFNRCIANTFIAFSWRCRLELFGIIRKRNDEYWFAAAWKRLQRFLKRKPDASISERGLVKDPPPFGSELLLEAEGVRDKDTYIEWAETIFPIYRANYRLMHRYFAAIENPSQSLSIEVDWLTGDAIHPELRAAIDAHILLNKADDWSV